MGDANGTTESYERALGLEKMRTVMQGKVPVLDLRLDNVTVLGKRTAKAEATNAFSVLCQCGAACRETQAIPLLDKVSATFPHGKLTLVIAPPGSGKTTLLRVLSGTMPFAPAGDSVDHGSPPSAPTAYGEYKLGGKSVRELGSTRTSRIVSRVVQDDVHYGLITVRETAQLAVRLSNPSVEPGTGRGGQSAAREAGIPEDIEEMFGKKAEALMELLGIDNVADTVIGNETVRGVSGGEAKRVTILEALATPMRALVMDDASNGLDGARTKDIIQRVRGFAQASNIPVVMSLQQPSREVFDLFDRVVLMRHGRVMYEGPRDEAGAFLASIGLAPPKHQSVPDWLLEVASNPALFHPEVEVLRKAHENGLAQFEFKKLNQPKEDSGNAVAKSSMGASSASAPREQQPPSAASGSAAANSHVAVSPSTVQLGENEHKFTRQLSSGDGQQRPFDALEAMHELPMYTTDGIATAFEEQWRQARPKAGSSTPRGNVEGATNLPGGYVPASAVPTSLPAAEAWPESQLSESLFGDGYATPLCTQFGLLLWREFTLMGRDLAFLRSHFVKCIVMGFLVGGLFFDLGDEDFQSFVALSFFAGLFLGMGNFAELPVTLNNRAVADKQVVAGMYNPTLYALVSNLAHLPVALLEAILLCTTIYWMSGFASDAERFVIFVFVAFLINVVLAAYFRSVAWLAGDGGFAMAQGMAIVPLALLMVTNGFIVTLDNLGPALQWFYYINPLSYMIRSLVVSEYSAPRWDTQIPVFEQVYSGNATQRVQVGAQRVGDVYLDTYDMPTDDYDYWVYTGIAVLAAEWLAFVIGGVLAFSLTRTHGSKGTQREEQEESELELATAASKAVKYSVSRARAAGKPDTAADAEVRAMSRGSKAVAAAGEASGGSAMMWENVRYTVKLPNGSDKTLLHGISGWAKPGQITALLGESGAGKSTLLDCLAGRKNQGKLEGSILLDGKPATRDAINLVASYVEQFDHHVPQQTVREALEFSADLRLPASKSPEERAAVVDRVLELLELDGIQDQRVGTPGSSGISAGERKRLSIAVELVSQPRIIFLDEPTTGLSSLYALGLMRALRRIADAGHSIVATVHQPSASIFFYMDRLLLLRRGGATVYFGPLGDKGSALTYYLEGCKGVRPLPEGTNPADWMLEVVGEVGKMRLREAERGQSPQGGNNGASAARASPTDVEAADGSTVGSVPDLADQFNESSAAATMKAGLATFRSGSGAAGLANAAAAPVRRGWCSEFSVVLWRTAVVSFRDIDYNTTRMIGLPVLAALFGLTFFQIEDTDQSGVFSVIGAAFLGGLFAAVIGMNLAIVPTITTRPSLYREIDAGFFLPESHSLATTLVEVPWVTALMLVYTAIFFFMLGLDESKFWFFYAAVLLLGHVFTFLGHTLAAVSNSQQIATAISSVLMGIFALFGGFLVPGPNMADGWVWIHYINPLRYGIGALVSPPFECGGVPDGGSARAQAIAALPAGESGPCATISVVNEGQLQPGVLKADFVESFFGFSFEHIDFYLGMLAMYCVILVGIKMLANRFVRHQSR